MVAESIGWSVRLNCLTAARVTGDRKEVGRFLVPAVSQSGSTMMDNEH